MHDPTEFSAIFFRVARDPWMPVSAIPERYLSEPDRLPNLAAISATPAVPTQPTAPNEPEVPKVVVKESGKPDFMADLILPSQRQPAALVTAAATKENSK